MPDETPAALSTLEQSILKAKGLTPEQIGALAGIGIHRRADFATVGDAGTLVQVLPGLTPAVAAEVMRWAVPTLAAEPTATTGPGARVVLDTSDAVYCVHCQAKQPKDYSSGDLCPNCGKQAEPIESCYWCSATGPGKFCRSCGATFVPTAELELAMMLRRDGLAKDAIPDRLASMSTQDKDALWGRVRHARG